ncbi:MAG: hypothetical protein H6983_13085 [Ectothiorhodospiraceae bacterium]|nr:hypothetical protein [Ectothiorhodospiraceae bacterium]
MTFDAFVRSLAEPAPPPDCEVALRALWYDANGRTDSAVAAAEFDTGHLCRRVRAYLHRKAGDTGNAELWYWRAGTTPWVGSLEDEWADIVHTILAERVVANAYT